MVPCPLGLYICCGMPILLISFGALSRFLAGSHLLYWCNGHTYTEELGQPLKDPILHSALNIKEGVAAKHSTVCKYQGFNLLLILFSLLFLSHKHDGNTDNSGKP